MAKDPEQRFADGNAFSAALRKALPVAVNEISQEGAGELQQAGEGVALKRAWLIFRLKGYGILGNASYTKIINKYP